jgi:hypothetical protein
VRVIERLRNHFPGCKWYGSGPKVYEGYLVTDGNYQLFYKFVKYDINLYVCELSGVEFDATNY